MKEYAYVRVKSKRGMVGFSFEEHRKIIDEYAKKGYRYAGCIPVLFVFNSLQEIDLIFEIER